MYTKRAVEIYAKVVDYYFYYQLKKNSIKGIRSYMNRQIINICLYFTNILFIYNI